MIIGTGIDIVEIDRFKKIKDLKGIAKKILHTNELEEFNKIAKDQTKFLAKKFAFKEAFVKALGTGFREPYYLDRIEIIKDKLGKPSVVTHEEAKKEFDERFIKIDWEKYYKDRPFNPSALSLYKWAPIADELKTLDRKIVLNSVILKWDVIKKEFKDRIQF